MFFYIVNVSVTHVYNPLKLPIEEDLAVTKCYPISDPIFIRATPQGPAAGSLCRPGVLSPLLVQPVSAVAVSFGLYLDRGVAPLGTGTHGARHGRPRTASA